MQFDQLKRREVITLLGAALTWPLAASGQQSDRVRRIGVLSTGFEANPVTQIHIQAFRQSLQKLGWTQGHNVQIDYRFAAGDPDRMRLNASEMVGLAPDVIVGGNTQTVEALQRATRTVPIVFVSVSDPVGRSFVGSLAHPGGNITGFTNEVEPLGGKWLQVLKEIAPRVTRVALMFNPDTALSYYLHQFEALAPSFAVKPITGAVHNAAEIEGALADLAREPDGGLIVMPDIWTYANRDLITTQAARYRVPAVYHTRIFATSGGLISYGVDPTDLWRRAASYVDLILKGEKPANLPVQRPTRLELVINLKTAKALGLTIPPNLLAIADEVIE
jgi:putative tryptophan/tyrosine transport system substrate-binding protein